MARKRANLTDLMNDLTFKTVFDKYRMIAMNIFEWTGLPEGIEERHIERELFDKGKCLFFRDPRMSYMALEAQDGQGLNVYGDPLTFRAIGYNYNKLYRADDCVLIENNKLRIPTRSYIYFYANKITEAERTMDVNVKANKTPTIFVCDENTLMSYKQIGKQIDGNLPQIWADKKLDINNIAVLDTKAKFLCNDLMNYKKSVENELLTFLGLNNMPVEKKERIITDEANSNNQLIDNFCELQLEARKRAADAINEMYGLSIKVEKRQSYEQSADNIVDNKGGGGE